MKPSRMFLKEVPDRRVKGGESSSEAWRHRSKSMSKGNRPFPTRLSILVSGSSGQMLLMLGVLLDGPEQIDDQFAKFPTRFPLPSLAPK